MSLNFKDGTNFSDSPNDSFVPILDNLKCNQFILKNQTHFIYAGYSGIPENLLINVICWIVLLTLFTVLRKKAWDYGRLALVQKYENRTCLHGYSRYNVWTHIFYGTDREQHGRHSLSETDSVHLAELAAHMDSGYFSWIPAIFKLKDEYILAKCGRDAVQYLSFQRHIIVYVMIVTVICIAVILPINFQGTLEGGTKDFGHTTLANLNPNSPFIWVHVTLAFMFLPLAIIFTRHFSQSLKISASVTSVSRTLMISRVPRKACQKEMVLKHFQEAYPHVEVQDVQFAYVIKKLVELYKEREIVTSARLYSETFFKDRRERLQMLPYKCGVVCGCCSWSGCTKVDAIEFYENEEAKLKAAVEEEKVRSLQRPSGISFVTFGSVDHAKAVLTDHTFAMCRRDPPTSSVSRDLKPHNWVVRFAPTPDDIYWPNLSVTTKLWYVKAMFINFLLFICLFFLTTPPVVITSLNLFIISDKLNQVTPLLSEFLPTLMLWTVAALMPVIVAYSDQFMSHWTRSAENHSVMRKTFIFLLFMLIILPSLGFTSAKAFVEWFVNDQLHQNQTYRWECMFLPDSGAFFVNYVVTSAFIGTTLELIRFPELFLYIIRLGLAKSEAETASVRKNILYEFQFGVQYAWMLLIFAMTIIYSIACPLITPFGLTYLVFKHLVDKYNIYFAYGPSKIRKSIHTSAVNFVITSLVILQFTLLFSSILRQGLKKALTIYSIILLCVTFLIYVMHIAFHWFQDLAPIKYKPTIPFDPSADGVMEGDDMEHDEEMGREGGGDDVGQGSFDGLSSYHFVPMVLRSPPNSSSGDRLYSPTTSRPRTSYGTNPDESGPLDAVDASLQISRNEHQRDLKGESLVRSSPEVHLMRFD